MNYLVCNFTGRVRRVTESGRQFLVAPMVLLNPGVLSGSKGPLLYEPSEIAKNHQQWNGMPLLVYHPHDPITNQPLSAQDPDQGPSIVEKQGVGEVRNTHIKNGKLRAEGWFDVEKTTKVDPRILANLKANRPCELSTGLFTDNEDTPGNFRGRPYTQKARNYRADHVAILPDQIGACSIKDGCGVLVNQRQPSSDDKTITITCTATAEPKIRKLLEKLKTLAGIGHSFDIAVDPENADYQESFDLDGDGSDHIISINKSGSNAILQHNSQLSLTLQEKLTMLTDNAEEESRWVTLPNGVHAQVKDGDIVKGPKIEKKSENKPEKAKKESAEERDARWAKEDAASQKSADAKKYEGSKKSDGSLKVLKQKAQEEDDDYRERIGRYLNKEYKDATPEQHDAEAKRYVEKFKSTGKSQYKVMAEEHINEASMKRGHAEFEEKMKDPISKAKIDALVAADQKKRFGNRVHNKLSAIINSSLVINPAWVEDHDIWEKAKKAADKGDYDDDSYYAVVTSIYKNMGGGIKESEMTKNEKLHILANSNPEGCNQYKDCGGGGVKKESDTTSKMPEGYEKNKKSFGWGGKGYYSAHLRFMDESRGERHFDTEYALGHKSNGDVGNGFMSISGVMGYNGRLGELDPATEGRLKNDLKPGSTLVVQTDRYNRHGKTSGGSIHILIDKLESVKDEYGTKKLKVSYTEIKSKKTTTNCLCTKLQVIANENPNRDELGRFASGSSGGSKGSGKGSAKVHGAAKEGHIARIVGSESHQIEWPEEVTQESQSGIPNEEEFAGKRKTGVTGAGFGPMGSPARGSAKKQGIHNMSSTLQDKLADILGPVENADVKEDESVTKLKQADGSQTPLAPIGSSEQETELRLRDGSEVGSDETDTEDQDKIEKGADSPLKADATALGAKDIKPKQSKKPEQSNAQTHNQEEGGHTMATVTLNAEEREAVVNGLIEGECCFEESERAVLNSLSDRTLARLTLNAKEMPKFIQDKIDAKKAKEEDSAEKEPDSKDEKEVENEDQKTEEEDRAGLGVRAGKGTGKNESQAQGNVKPYGELNPKPDENCSMTKNQLSDDDRQFLAIGRKVVADRRSDMIKTITANSRNPFDKKELEGMEFNQLEKLSQLAAVESEAVVPSFTLNRFSGFMGAAAGVGQVNNDSGVDEDILETPTINYSEIASKGIQKR